MRPMERTLFAEEHDLFRGSFKKFVALEVTPHQERWMRDGIVDREEAKLVFHLNEVAGTGNDQAWYDFFVEALTDYFVWKQEPLGYLSDEDADFLVAQITRDGKIDDNTEFGLLVNIIHRLRVSPEKVVLLTLRGVKETVGMIQSVL